MTDKCLCEATDTLIFPCSGGSNVGQIANEAAKELTMSGNGRMYCLAGIGGHVSGLVESTKSAKRIVAIDGCQVECAKKVLEHAGFKVSAHAVVTELGIKKESGFDYGKTDIKTIIDYISSRR